MIIKKLPDHVINQIAAGEVIERPASIVKELMENALDAGASQIKIDIENAGLDSIQITDNGCGMVKEDLLIATECHATSKIEDAMDLFSIASFGFRGEALASISAISDLSIQSKHSSEAHGWLLSNENNTLNLAPSSIDQGTCLSIKNLFYNIPVRKKFLKSPKTEFERIHETVKRIALSSSNTEIILSHNQKVIRKYDVCPNLPKERRVSQIISKDFLENSIYIERNEELFSLEGYIGRPTFHKSKPDHQFFYVNTRFIKDSTIQHAIKLAYQDVLYSGKHPIFHSKSFHSSGAHRYQCASDETGNSF